MTPGHLWWRPWLVLLVTMPVLAGCGSGGDGATVVATTDSSGLAASDSSAASGSHSDNELPASDPDDPFAVFGLPRPSVVETTIREITLRIVNTGDTELLVLADAGAGPVPVDTIAGTDSVRVRLETRADSVRLSGLDRSGSEVGFRWVRPDSIETRAAFP